MGDMRQTRGGASPLDSWSAMSASEPSASGAQGQRPPRQRRAEGYEENGTRMDLPALTPQDGPDGRSEAQPPIYTPQQAPQAQQAPAQLSHAPWTVASSWGASSLNTPNTLAGVSYLFWWVSGLWVYFNERRNRFVRFHAVQSILLTGALTVVSVFLYMLWQLSGDLAAATHQAAFAHVGQGIALLGVFGVLALWLATMIAAWSGHHLRLPIIGGYAERYAAPPREPFPPSPFAD